jgi:hypothetical protein
MAPCRCRACSVDLSGRGRGTLRNAQRRLSVCAGFLSEAVGILATWLDVGLVARQTSDGGVRDGGTVAAIPSSDSSRAAPEASRKLAPVSRLGVTKACPLTWGEWSSPSRELRIGRGDEAASTPPGGASARCGRPKERLASPWGTPVIGAEGSLGTMHVRLCVCSE